LTTTERLPSVAVFHSRYNPQKEAKRHVEKILSGKKPSIVFIIGGGLNYISAVFAENYPKIKCISLQPCDDFLGREVVCPKINWHPSSNKSLQEIIQSGLAGNQLAGGILVLEWPPVVNQFQEISTWIRVSLRDLLEKASSNAATTGYWAARWLRNSIKFVRSVTWTSSLAPGSSMIVLACAGPSLADSMPEISARRSHLALWALASAVPALLQYGLVPDLVISTDPGFWNGAHLREACLQHIPIAMPPSSYAYSEIFNQSTVIPLNTGLIFERAAFETMRINFEVAQASGSATGTALSLASRCTNGPIAIAGFDLAARGLIDHVQPYAFDVLDKKVEQRLDPVYSARALRVFENYPVRSGDWRRSRAFSTYAETIRVSSNDSARFFRLGTSSIETNICRADFRGIPAGSGTKPECISPNSCEGATTKDRDELIEKMLDFLAETAIKQATKALEKTEPLPNDAALYYKALAPRESARLLADAARGEASLDDMRLVASTARANAASWI